MKGVAVDFCMSHKSCLSMQLRRRCKVFSTVLCNIGFTFAISIGGL